MAGTRTAPTIDGSFTFIKVSVTVYDYTGDQRTDTYQFDADTTNLEIEAFISALQAITNGTIWRVAVSQIYNSVGDSSNALEEVWEEASANLSVLLKDSNDNAMNVFVPAPSNDLFIEGTDEIDPTNTEFVAFLASILPMRAGYSVVSARFTNRRNIGTVVRI